MAGWGPRTERGLGADRSPPLACRAMAIVGGDPSLTLRLLHSF